MKTPLPIVPRQIFCPIMEKTCPRCSITKPVEEFSTKTKVKGGKRYLMSECRVCSAVRMRARHRMQKNALRLRDKCFDLLGHVCKRCGFSDKRGLQFDHINGGGYQDRKKYRGQGMYRHILKIGG